MKLVDNENVWLGVVKYKQLLLSPKFAQLFYIKHYLYNVTFHQKWTKNMPVLFIHLQKDKKLTNLG